MPFLDHTHNKGIFYCNSLCSSYILKIFFILSLIFLILFTNIATAQILPTDTATGKIVYAETVSADLISKQALYSKMVKWFKQNYKSELVTTILRSQEEGKIIWKCAFELTVIRRYKMIKTPVELKILYTLALNFVDNSFKYEITGFYVVTEKEENALESYETDAAKMIADFEKEGKITDWTKDRILEQIEFNKGILDGTDKHIKVLIMSLKGLY